ncbi:NUDIX hydrolase [Streptomyces anulatus]|uniref:NUDIX hydrolase n=1 Tax=Streptomyces anulatus TaxID=1892 RepID=UPI0036BA5171
MRPVRSPALVHPAFEDPAVFPGASLHLASGHAPLLQEHCSNIHHHEPGDGPDRITDVVVGRPWAGEPRNAEHERHEELSSVSMEKPPPDYHPYTTGIFHMITLNPSYRALPWPTQGGSE